VATVEPGYALAEVPGHDDAGAGQQPADPPRPASRGCAACVRPAGDDRPLHRAGTAHPGGERPGRDIFWLVAAHGTQADYVRNLRTNPRVRVKADGAWRAGTAIALPGDDALARSRTLPYQWDAAIGRMMASAPLTIRIDLDSAP
jgi:hypothetical protein